MREQKEFEEPYDKEAAPKNLSRCLEIIAEELRKDQIPVTPDCRIDMNAFETIYGKNVIKEDSAYIKSYEKDWYGDVSPEEQKQQRLQKTGEQLEMLKTAVFHKNLGSRFVVVRASAYDDKKNKVDNVLLDKTTGTLVCAFDEVADTTGPDYEKKRTIVLERNTRERGARMKYCIGLDIKDGVGTLQLKSEEQIPMFYLALSKDYIAKTLKDFIPNTSQQSEAEKKLFSYFIAALKFQISELELRAERLAPALRTRLKNFRKLLHEYA